MGPIGGSAGRLGAGGLGRWSALLQAPEVARVRVGLLFAAGYASWGIFTAYSPANLVEAFQPP
jgi:hypothetical protein